MSVPTEQHLSHLQQYIISCAKKLGFQDVGFSNLNLAQAEQQLQQWLEQGLHGEMYYMYKHGSKRTHPEQLVPHTLSIISVRMDYFPPHASHPLEVLTHPEMGYISRYALGRDYHKVLRKRLQQLAQTIQQEIGHFSYRVFVDSAPVMEKAIAEKAGLGWIGKHSNLIHKKSGSWFFLGEIYTDLPLAPDTDVANSNHCGNCSACMDICPTQAIIAPYMVDARLCISYLTIEYKKSIPVALRHLFGNRIYGCDDCQLICPWNRFARESLEADFSIRHQLDKPSLLQLFSWSETEFLQYTQGNPIRRIGYVCWQRNISIALGNALRNSQDIGSQRAIYQALEKKKQTTVELVQEHINWALQQNA